MSGRNSKNGGDKVCLALPQDLLARIYRVLSALKPHESLYFGRQALTESSIECEQGPKYMELDPYLLRSGNIEGTRTEARQLQERRKAGQLACEFRCGAKSAVSFIAPIDWSVFVRITPAS